MTMLSGHQLGAGIEWDLRPTRKVVAERVGFHATFERHGQQRGLSRIAQRAPARVAGIGWNQLRIVAQDRCLQQ